MKCQRCGGDGLDATIKVLRSNTYMGPDIQTFDGGWSDKAVVACARCLEETRAMRPSQREQAFYNHLSGLVGEGPSFQQMADAIQEK